MERLALILLAVWTGVSLLVYLAPLGPVRIRRIVEGLAELDPFQLLHTWNLFAPKPPSGDIHLLVRHRRRDGTLTRWREAPLTQDRRLLHALWHPGVLTGAAFQRLAFAFCQPVSLRAEARMVSVPYLALLNYAVHQPCPEDAEAVQFLLAQTSAEHPAHQPRPLFLSGLHPVAPADLSHHGDPERERQRD